MKRLIAVGAILLLAPIAGSPQSTAAAIDWKACTPYCIRDVKADVATLISGANKQKFPVSIISLQQARTILNAQHADASMSYAYPLEGDPQRAHLLGKSLSAVGLLTGKAWLIGTLKYERDEFGPFTLGYRIATVVLIREGDAVVPYIIDPSLQSEPLSYQAWTRGQDKIAVRAFSNQYSYSPSDLTDSPDAYGAAELADAQKGNAALLKRLAEYRARQSALRPLGLQRVINTDCNAGLYVNRLVERNNAFREALAGKDSAQMLRYVDDQVRSGRLGPEYSEQVRILKSLGGGVQAKTVRMVLMGPEDDDVQRDLVDMEYGGVACMKFVRGAVELWDHEPNEDKTYLDYSHPIKWFRESADEGYQPAQEQLFQIYQLPRQYRLREWPAKRALEEAFKSAGEIAESNEESPTKRAHAMTNLAMMYQWGIGTDLDLKQAVQWYQKAADIGDARAMTYLGRIYAFDGGDVIPPAPDKALALYKRASDLGNGHGTQNYALLRYEKPQSLADEKALTELLEKAVRQGFPPAVSTLAPRCRDGLGTEKNPERAFMLLKTTHEQWHSPFSASLLITAYLKGIGTPVSRDKARAVYDQCSREIGNSACDTVWKDGGN